MKITVATDIKQLRAAKKKEISARLSASGKVCRDAVGAYFGKLAQLAPPNIGSVEIDQKLYERPAMLLPVAIARGSRTLAADRQALADGYSWKVVRKKKAPLYFKGKGKNIPPAVKKARHIVNRGLLRWAFVGMLPEAGVAVPVVMRPLAAAKRGTNLKKIESLVASATFAVMDRELLIRVQQNVASAGPYRWYADAARIAEDHHDWFMQMKLSKFGKVEKR